MFVAEAREVDANGNAIGDAPGAGDHDAVGVMCAAQDKRGDRIARAGKAQLIERVESKIGLLAGGNGADVAPAETTRGTFGGPAERVEMSYVRRAVAQAIEHQGVAHAFHEIGIVVRGGPINPEADDGACRFQFFGAALS